MVERSSVSLSASTGPFTETMTQSGEALSYSVTPITGLPAALRTSCSKSQATSNVMSLISSSATRCATFSRSSFRADRSAASCPRTARATDQTSAAVSLAGVAVVLEWR